MEPATDEELQELYEWVDEIPLSRPKRNIARDFSDAVLLAEVIAHYHPRLVQLHNYSSANSLSQKAYNWKTINGKVLRRLGFSLSQDDIDGLISCAPGAVEALLKTTKKKLAAFSAASVPREHTKSSRNEQRAATNTTYGEQKAVMTRARQPLANHDGNAHVSSGSRESASPVEVSPASIAGSSQSRQTQAQARTVARVDTREDERGSEHHRENCHPLQQHPQQQQQQHRQPAPARQQQQQRQQQRAVQQSAPHQPKHSVPQPQQPPPQRHPVEKRRQEQEGERRFPVFRPSVAGAGAGHVNPMSLGNGSELTGNLHRMIAADEMRDSVRDELLVDKEATIMEMRETMAILEKKIRKLEQLVKIKDAKIQALSSKIRATGVE